MHLSHFIHRKLTYVLCMLTVTVTTLLSCNRPHIPAMFEEDHSFRTQGTPSDQLPILESVSSQEASIAVPGGVFGADTADRSSTDYPDRISPTTLSLIERRADLVPTAPNSNEATRHNADLLELGEHALNATVSQATARSGVIPVDRLHPSRRQQLDLIKSSAVGASAFILGGCVDQIRFNQQNQQGERDSQIAREAVTMSSCQLEEQLAAAETDISLQTAVDFCNHLPGQLESLKTAKQEIEERLHTAEEASLTGSIAMLSSDIRQKLCADALWYNFLNSMSFGKSSWSHYFGDIGASPALPSAIHAILVGPCPFQEHRRVYETHLLVLIPATINGKDFSLNLLRELIHHPQGGGHVTQYRYYHSRVAEQLGASSPVSSYWVLMTRDVLKGHCNRPYSEQKTMLAHYESQGYALPTSLEAATVILAHHVRTGERLYSDAPLTYARCRDQVEWEGSLYPVTVGGFSSGGLAIYKYSLDYYADADVSVCRKL